MTIVIDQVRQVVIDSLELTGPSADIAANAPLFGAIPELDSFGVVQLVDALEDRFDIVIEDDEFGAELFETLASLAEYVESKAGGG